MAIPTMERRFVKGAEVRTSDDGHISGHAAVFNEEYVVFDWMGYRVVETIAPGAFARAIREKQDVRALYNHDANNLLGRTSANTLRLLENDHGLYFDCEPPDTQLGRDVRTLIKRKDLSGCSFAFTVTKQNRTEEEKDGKIYVHREIQDVDLFDVGPVTYPAYEGTDVKSRSVELRAIFPEGIPEKLREPESDASYVIGVDLGSGRNSTLRIMPVETRDQVECQCTCRACFSGECDECSMHMTQCADKNCRCSVVASTETPVSTEAPPNVKTKRVHGEELPASAFLYVGDADKPETWAMPWQFSSAEKTKKHLRNLLARFNFTKKAPTEQKDALYRKLVRLCKQFELKVSDEEAKRWELTSDQQAALRQEGAHECECTCASCQGGNCEECSKDDCADANCEHDDGDMDSNSQVLSEEERSRLLARLAEVSN